MAYNSSYYALGHNQSNSLGWIWKSTEDNLTHSYNDAVNSTDDFNKIYELPKLKDEDIIQFANGGEHSVILKKDGTIMGSGATKYFLPDTLFRYYKFTSLDTNGDNYQWARISEFQIWASDTIIWGYGASNTVLAEGVDGTDFGGFQGARVDQLSTGTVGNSTFYMNGESGSFIMDVGTPKEATKFRFANGNVTGDGLENNDYITKWKFEGTNDDPTGSPTWIMLIDNSNGAIVNNGTANAWVGNDTSSSTYSDTTANLFHDITGVSTILDKFTTIKETSSGSPISNIKRIGCNENTTVIQEHNRGKLYVMGVNSHILGGNQSDDADTINSYLQVKHDLAADNTAVLAEGIVDFSIGGSEFMVYLDNSGYIWGTGKVGTSTYRYFGLTGSASSGNGNLWRFNRITDDGVRYGSSPVSGVTAFCCGEKNTYIHKSSGGLYATGRYFGGGSSVLTDKTIFTQIVDSSSQAITDVIKIVVLKNAAFILKQDGTLWSAGYSSSNMTFPVGDTNYFTRVTMGNTYQYFTDVVDIKSTYDTIYITVKNGEVYSGGRNNEGQLGLGNTTSSQILNIIPENTTTFIDLKVSDEEVLADSYNTSISTDKIIIPIVKPFSFKLGKINIYVNDDNIFSSSHEYGSGLSKTLFISFWTADGGGSTYFKTGSNSNTFNQDPRSVLNGTPISIWGGSNRQTQPIYFKLEKSSWTPTGGATSASVSSGGSVKYTFDPSSGYTSWSGGTWNSGANCIPAAPGDQFWADNQTPSTYEFSPNIQYIAIIQRFNENSFPVPNTYSVSTTVAPQSWKISPALRRIILSNANYVTLNKAFITDFPQKSLLPGTSDTDANVSLINQHSYYFTLSTTTSNILYDFDRTGGATWGPSSSGYGFKLDKIFTAGGTESITFDFSVKPANEQGIALAYQTGSVWSNIRYVLASIYKIRSPEQDYTWQTWYWSPSNHDTTASQSFFALYITGNPENNGYVGGDAWHQQTGTKLSSWIWKDFNDIYPGHWAAPNETGSPRTGYPPNYFSGTIRAYKFELVPVSGTTNYKIKIYIKEGGMDSGNDWYEIIDSETTYEPPEGEPDWPYYLGEDELFKFDFKSYNTSFNIHKWEIKERKCQDVKFDMEYSQKGQPEKNLELLTEKTDPLSKSMFLRRSLRFPSSQQQNLYGSGQNNTYQLGIGPDAEDKSTFQQIYYDPIAKSFPITNVKQIVCGEKYSLILLHNGTVLGSGLNNYGQLGIGDTTGESYNKFTIIPGVNSVDYISTSCSSDTADEASTYIIKRNGELFGTGSNINNRLGLNGSTGTGPKIFSIIHTFSTNVGLLTYFFIPEKILVGKYGSLLLGRSYNNGGHIFTTGLTTTAGCGMTTGVTGYFNRITTDGNYQSTNTDIRNVKDIAMSEGSCIILYDDGTLAYTGDNSNAQLGIPNSTASLDTFTNSTTHGKGITNIYMNGIGDTSTDWKKGNSYYIQKLDTITLDNFNDEATKKWYTITNHGLKAGDPVKIIGEAAAASSHAAVTSGTIVYIQYNDANSFRLNTNPNPANDATNFIYTPVEVSHPYRSELGELPTSGNAASYTTSSLGSIEPLPKFYSSSSLSAYNSDIINVTSSNTDTAGFPSSPQPNFTNNTITIAQALSGATWQYGIRTKSTTTITVLPGRILEWEISPLALPGGGTSHCMVGWSDNSRAMNSTSSYVGLGYAIRLYYSTSSTMEFDIWEQGSQISPNNAQNVVNAIGGSSINNRALNSGQAWLTTSKVSARIILSDNGSGGIGGATYWLKVGALDTGTWSLWHTSTDARLPGISNLQIQINPYAHCGNLIENLRTKVETSNNSLVINDLEIIDASSISVGINSILVKRQNNYFFYGDNSSNQSGMEGGFDVYSGNKINSTYINTHNVTDKFFKTMFITAEQLELSTTKPGGTHPFNDVSAFQLQQFLGGYYPILLDEHYVNTTNNNNVVTLVYKNDDNVTVPSSGQISLNNFRGMKL